MRDTTGWEILLFHIWSLWNLEYRNCVLLIGYWWHFEKKVEAWKITFLVIITISCRVAHKQKYLFLLLCAPGGKKTEHNWLSWFSDKKFKIFEKWPSYHNFCTPKENSEYFWKYLFWNLKSLNIGHFWRFGGIIFLNIPNFMV